MLMGRILFVDATMVIKTAGFYAVVGLLHFSCRRPFLLISFQPEVAEARGMHVRWWDFLFCGTFGVIVTSSVQMAGVLLVFSYLIAPAVCAMLFFRGIAPRLWFGWAVGLLASVVGIMLSLPACFDAPVGGRIVVAIGGLLVLLLFIRTIWSSIVKQGMC